jgi:hypothetical protein
VVRPEFPGDPLHAVNEPTVDEITAKLTKHGIPGEVAVWQSSMQKAGA